jgi:hypothetical protein
MPTIAWFYGIAIRMYFLDHPPPHFQAVYGEHEANVAIATGEVIEGGCRERQRVLSGSGRSRTGTNCRRIGIAHVLGSRSIG